MTFATFADMTNYARDHHRAHMADALDRPLPHNDWLRTCAQAREARLIKEREDD